jgi:integrase
LTPRRREGPRLQASGYYAFDAYVGFGPEARRFRYSLKTRDPIQAQFRYEQELRRQWSAYYGIEAPGRRFAASFTDVGREFIAYLRDTRKTATWKLVRDRMNILAGFWQDIDLTQITKQKLSDLDKWLAAKGRGEFTRNHYFALVRAFFAYAIREKKFFGDNPAVGIRPYIVIRKRREYSAEEIGRIIDAADTIERKAPANAKTHRYLGRIVRLLLLTGMRLNEVLNLRWSSIAEDRIMFTAAETKQRKEKIVPITPAIRAILDTLHDARRKDGYVIPVERGRTGLDMSQAIGKIREASGVQDFIFHGLRHTAASIMVSEALGRGVGLADIMAVLGHSQVETLMKYQHLDLTRMRRAMEALGEKFKK